MTRLGWLMAAILVAIVAVAGYYLYGVVAQLFLMK